MTPDMLRRGSEYYCYTCGRLFTKKTIDTHNKLIHSAIYNNGISVLCPVCSTLLPTEPDLQIHAAVHSENSVRHVHKKTPEKLKNKETKEKNKKQKKLKKAKDGVMQTDDEVEARTISSLAIGDDDDDKGDPGHSEQSQAAWYRYGEYGYGDDEDGDGWYGDDEDEDGGYGDDEDEDSGDE